MPLYSVTFIASYPQDHHRICKVIHNLFTYSVANVKDFSFCCCIFMYIVVYLCIPNGYLLINYKRGKTMNQTQYNYHINKFNEQIEKLQDVLYTLNQLHVSIETIIAVQDEMQKIIDAKYQFVKANQPKQ